MSDSFENPPTHPPAPRQTASSSGKAKVIIITAAITAVVTSIWWVGIGVVFYLYKNAEPPPFTITIDAPEVMEVGEQTQLVVTISNHSDKSATLGSVDIFDTLMDGFSLKSVDPKPDSQTAIFGIHSFYSKQKLEPSESTTFTFTLEAVVPGLWSSTIDACTPMENFVSEWVEIEVLEQDASAEAPQPDGESGTN